MKTHRSRASATDTRNFYSKLLLPYNSTPEAFIRKVLEEIHPNRGQLIYDLGCGDGRVLCIAAQEFGLRAKGFEIDERRILECRRIVKSLPWKTQRRIRIYEKDLFTVNLEDADIVFLYVLPDNYKFLIHVLQTCRSECTVVLMKYEPDDEVKMKMKLKVERRIQAEGTDWLAYIARKCQKEAKII